MSLRGRPPGENAVTSTTHSYPGGYYQDKKKRYHQIANRKLIPYPSNVPGTDTDQKFIGDKGLMGDSGLSSRSPVRCRGVSSSPLTAKEVDTVE